jgi:hypothetical protein
LLKDLKGFKNLSGLRSLRLAPLRALALKNHPASRPYPFRLVDWLLVHFTLHVSRLSSPAWKSDRLRSSIFNFQS